jgi:hypothetical protein
MSGYWIQVFLLRVTCKDTESIHSSDKFALAGDIVTDRANVALIKPMFRINSGDEHSFLPSGPIFSGWSSQPKVGITLQAWDLDENDSWVDNEEDIVTVGEAISTAVKAVPEYGTFAGAVLDGILATVPPVVDRFIDWDKNDQLMNHKEWVDLPAGVPEVMNEIQHSIRFYRDDPTGYSSWDYTIQCAIQCTPSAPIFEPTPPDPIHGAMGDFRFRADAAAKEQRPGAFPNFYLAHVGANHVGGTIFLHAAMAEWRDVPLAELGNPSLEDFGGRLRGTQDHALKQGFAGGFPNYYHADYGNGVVCGTALIRPPGAELRDVPISELGNPALDDIGARFRGTQDYAIRNGFVGGFPNFYHADYGKGIVCGTILIKPIAGEWRDLLLFQDPH